MEVKTTKESLYSGLNKVSKAINQKSTQAIMTCVLIEAGEDISLTGNNLEIGIRTIISGQIEDGGSIAVESKTLMDIVGKMPGGDITLTTKDNLLTIKGGKSKFSIAYRESTDYPAIPEIEDSKHFSMDSRFFKDIVRQVSFAAGVNSSNRVMNGIYFTSNEDVLTAVALDGFRIAIRNTVVGDMPEIKAIVPAKSIADVSKILGDSEIDVWVSDNHFEIDDGDTHIITRLIDGEYMDINRVISNETPISIEVGKKDLYDSIDRSSLLIKDGSKKPVVLNINGERIDISARATNGLMEETIDTIHYGDDLRIGFDPHFMLDTLSAIEDESIKVYFANPKSPAFIKDDEKTYVYVVLPVNIGE